MYPSIERVVTTTYADLRFFLSLSLSPIYHQLSEKHQQQYLYRIMMSI
ncbi:hypothetical protein OAV88_01300 [bacterium]|nr:hypothetical protein [bacterium]